MYCGLSWFQETKYRYEPAITVHRGAPKKRRGRKPTILVPADPAAAEASRKGKVTLFFTLRMKDPLTYLFETYLLCVRRATFTSCMLKANFFCYFNVFDFRAQSGLRTAVQGTEEFALFVPRRIR